MNAENNPAPRTWIKREQYYENESDTSPVQPCDTVLSKAKPRNPQCSGGLAITLPVLGAL